MRVYKCFATKFYRRQKYKKIQKKTTLKHQKIILKHIKKFYQINL